jgi:hypothetical protein
MMRKQVERRWSGKRKDRSNNNNKQPLNIDSQGGAFPSYGVVKIKV